MHQNSWGCNNAVTKNDPERVIKNMDEGEAAKQSRNDFTKIIKLN